MRGVYKLLGVFLAVLLLSASCKYSEEFQQVSIKNQYTLELPDYVSAADNLNPEASLQYSNLFRNFYMVVIDYPKSTDSLSIQSLHSKKTEELKNMIQKSSVHTARPQTINELKTIRQQVSGIVGNEQVEEKINYELAFIEGKNHLYQITIWTWYKWQEKYEQDIDRIIGSFEEL